MEKLKLVINNKEERSDRNEMSTPTLVTGGGSTPGSINWLVNLEIGTLFLIKDKHTHDFNLGAFRVLDKTEKAVYLGSNLNNPVVTFVDPDRFCNKYTLFEVLGVIKDPVVSPEMLEEEDKKDITDG